MKMGSRVLMKEASGGRFWGDFLLISHPVVAYTYVLSSSSSLTSSTLPSHPLPSIFVCICTCINTPKPPQNPMSRHYCLYAFLQTFESMRMHMLCNPSPWRSSTLCRFQQYLLIFGISGCEAELAELAARSYAKLSLCANA